LIIIAFMDIFGRKAIPDMGLGDNIKKIREQKGLLQKQLAIEVDIPYTSYNKIENGTREVSIEELERLAAYFGMTIDQVVHPDDQPIEVTIQDKPGFEQINLINQLDEEDRTIVFKIIDTMLTKKKFKDFFQKNMASF
jgi:transcriptional regulator with XRE-family HTH domain